MSRKEIVADDLTGADLTGQENTQVKITFDGKSATVDLSDASRAALADFVAGNGSAALARLLAKSDAGKPSRARSAPRSGTSDGAVKRVWLRANGYPNLAERGKFSAEMNAAYETHAAAHAVGGTAGAARPTGNVSVAPASTDSKSA